MEFEFFMRKLLASALEASQGLTITPYASQSKAKKRTLAKVKRLLFGFIYYHVFRVKRFAIFSLWAYKNRQSNSSVVDLRMLSDLLRTPLEFIGEDVQRAIKALQTRFHYRREPH